ncbi:hypothetical protein ACLOJK_018163 [Asimina triloba]
MATMCVLLDRDAAEELLTVGSAGLLLAVDLVGPIYCGDRTRGWGLWIWVTLSWPASMGALFFRWVVIGVWTELDCSPMELAGRYCRLLLLLTKEDKGCWAVRCCRLLLMACPDLAWFECVIGVAMRDGGGVVGCCPPSTLGKMQRLRIAVGGDEVRDALQSRQIRRHLVIANLFDSSYQPSKMSPTMGSAATMSKTKAHFLDGDDVARDARQWGNRAPLVAAVVVLPRTDRLIGGSPEMLQDGSHAWLPLMVMEHHISMLQRCTEVWCTRDRYFVI